MNLWSGITLLSVHTRTEMLGSGNSPGETARGRTILCRLAGTCKRRSPNLVAAGPRGFEFELAGRPPSLSLLSRTR